MLVSNFFVHIQKLQPIDLTEWNQHADPDFVFYDGKMVEKCRSGDPVSLRTYVTECILS